VIRRTEIVLIWGCIKNDLIMKRLKIVVALSVLTLGIYSFIPHTPSLEIGSKAPLTNVEMKDVSGEMYSLEKLKNDEGLLVIFSCNTCPFVVGTGSKEGWEKRYNGIYELAIKNRIGMVLINSNEAYRSDVDSFDKMVAHAKKLGYKSPYVVDKGHALADAFGAKTTPHVFLFNSEMELVYKGAIDDNNASSSDVKEHYLRSAIDHLNKGENIDPNSTKALGCSIKRVKS